MTYRVITADDEIVVLAVAPARLPRLGLIGGAILAFALVILLKEGALASALSTALLIVVSSVAYYAIGSSRAAEVVLANGREVRVTTLLGKAMGVSKPSYILDEGAWSTERVYIRYDSLGRAWVVVRTGGWPPLTARATQEGERLLRRDESRPG